MRYGKAIRRARWNKPCCDYFCGSPCCYNRRCDKRWQRHDLPGIGDSAFKAGTDQSCTLLFLKGTTLVSILFGGTGAQAGAVAVAKIAASKL